MDEDEIHLLEDEDVVVGSSSLTEAQDKVLFLVPVLSGLLSAWGSANIIVMFLQTDQSKRTCYKRIMLGLSCSDLMSSITLALQAFLLPKETSQRIWSSGNETTCQMMGFFQQFSFSALFYNGMLSCMFLLTIRFSVSEERLSRVYEPLMHTISIGWPLITALVGLALGMYDELVVGHFCWFTGPQTTLYAMIVSALPGFFFIMLVIPLNNLLVYCHVRKRLRQTTTMTSTVALVALGHHHYHHQQDPHAHHGDEGDVEAHPTNTPATSSASLNDDSKNNNDPEDTLPTAEQQQQQQQQQQPLEIQSTITATNQPSLGSTGSHHGSSNPSTAWSDEQTRQRQRDYRLSIEREKVAQKRKNEHLQKVAFQSFLYVASFMASYLPSGILRVISGTVGLTPQQEGDFFPLLLIQAILMPLQGLFNYFIYLKSATYVQEAIH